MLLKMQYGVQMKGAIAQGAKYCSKRVAELLSCDATYCSEEVAVLISCDSDATRCLSLVMPKVHPIVQGRCRADVF